MRTRTDPTAPLLVGDRGAVVVRRDEHSRRDYTVRPGYHPDPEASAPRSWIWTFILLSFALGVLTGIALGIILVTWV